MNIVYQIGDALGERLKETGDFVKARQSTNDECIGFVVMLLTQHTDQVRREERKKIYEDFVHKFCNDHNSEIRWLRGVFFDRQDGLNQILDFLNQSKESDSLKGSE